MFSNAKVRTGKGLEEDTTLGIQSESGPENNETQTLFNELFHFHFINIPPPGPQRKLVYHFLLHRCVFPASPLGSPLGDQHKLWTLPPLTALRGHLSSRVLSGNDQQTLPSCQVGLMLRGPSFKRPPFCPMAAPAGHSNSCERLPVLANVKRGPGKASQSFSSEVPQPAKQYAIIQCLQFIFLCSSPTVTLERKLICRKIAPASELLLQNV